MEISLGRTFSYIGTLLLLCTLQAGAVLQYTILESLPPQSVIGNIPRDSGLDEIRTQAELEQLTYSFLNQPGSHSEYFSVDENTGILRTATVIDRDAICLHQSACLLQVDVATGPAQFFHVINIEIQVDDINDSPPTFTQDYIELSISELSVPGASFPLPIALDRDSGLNGLDRYTLRGSSLDWELDQSVGPGANSELNLILTRQLDREVLSYYELTVVAYDSGVPVLSGTLIIDVTVTDANDNNPHFTNETYTVYINEDSPVNNSLLQVRAVDADIGANGAVVYSFASQTELIYGTQFGIRPATGEIYLKTPLHYNENSNIYELTVNARDQGEGMLSDRATVVFYVSDVNNNAPQITVNTLTADGLPQVSEYSHLGDFVAHISASDLDGGANGRVNCTLQGNGFALEKLENDAQYKVVTTMTFDRELRSQYEVTIYCRDFGTPYQSSSYLMTIAIADENDHAPVFTQDQYYTSVEENNAPGEFIMQVNASDLDVGDNGLIHYQIEGDDGGYFTIQSPEGIIQAQRRLDYEVISVVDFVVIAFDHGDPQLSASASVTITIMDQNDNAPTFVLDQYSFSVMENIPSNTPVGTIHAVDLDRTPYNTIEYGLAPYGSIDEFMINSVTGEIWTLRSLDREINSQHYLVATVTNPGFPLLTSTVSVIISVGDQNDNSPVVEFPPPGQNTTVLVYNDVPVGFMVTQIIANDPDSQENAQLTFLIEEGNIDHVFAMDENTGIITVNKNLGDLELRQYFLRILILDNGLPQRISWTSITIDVNQSLVMDSAYTGGLLTGTNKTIVISLATASSFIVIVLIASILIIKSYDKRNRSKNGQNQVRIEIQKMLGTNSDKESSEGQASPARGHCSMESTEHKEPVVTANGGDKVNSKAKTNLPKVNNHSSNGPYSMNYQTAILPQVHFAGSTRGGNRKNSLQDRPNDHQIAEYHTMHEMQPHLKRKASDPRRDKPHSVVMPQNHLPSKQTNIGPQEGSLDRKMGSSDRIKDPTLPRRGSSLKPNATSPSQPNPGALQPQQPPQQQHLPHHMHPQNTMPHRQSDRLRQNPLTQRQPLPINSRRQPPPPPPPPSSFRPHQPSAAFRHPPSSRHPVASRHRPAAPGAAGRHYPGHPSASHPPTMEVYPVSEGELEIQRILQMLEREDAESTLSGDGSNTSNTDSGKGPSEEGGDNSAASQLDSSVEQVTQRKLADYLRNLDQPDPVSSKLKRVKDYLSPTESDDYNALLERLGISGKYPSCSTRTDMCSPVYTDSDQTPSGMEYYSHKDISNDDAVVPNCSHASESNQSEPRLESHDLRGAPSLVSLDGQSSVNDIADDATTTSGSYVCDLEDLKSELEDLKCDLEDNETVTDSTV